MRADASKQARDRAGWVAAGERHRQVVQTLREAGQYCGTCAHVRTSRRGADLICSRPAADAGGWVTTHEATCAHWAPWSSARAAGGAA